MIIDVSGKYKRIVLPRTWIKDNKECFYDEIRRKNIFMTQEERIRQKTVQFIINELKVPKNMIMVEESLRHYRSKTKWRADIVIRGLEKDKNEYSPIAVIECKSSENLVNDNTTLNQVKSYADEILCDYIFITNGREMCCAKWNCNINDYEWLKEIPTYKNMLQGNYILAEDEEFKRYALEDLMSGVQERYKYYEFGIHTPKKMLPFLVNLHDCFLDCSHTLSEKKYKIFTLKQDLCLMSWKAGNHSGGMFNGLYRAFEIIYKNKIYIVGLGFQAYSKSSKPEISKTALCIGVEYNGISHHSIQMVMEKYVNKAGDVFTITHDGRIAVGNIGCGKPLEVKKRVEMYYPKIIKDNNIVLGKLKNDHLFYLDEPDVAELVENLISYALIRDDYRKYKKQVNKSQNS